jgi:hypothetical protein
MFLSSQALAFASLRTLKGAATFDSRIAPRISNKDINCRIMTVMLE